MASRARLIRVPGPVRLPFYVLTPKEGLCYWALDFSCLVTVYLMSDWHLFSLSPFLIPREFDKSRREKNSDPAGTVGVALHYNITRISCRYTSAVPFPSARNPPTTTLSPCTASALAFAMNLACATATDSIVQSSALPLVDKVCREIEPSRVIVMIDEGSRKALSTYGYIC